MVSTLFSFVGKPKGFEGGGRLWQTSDKEQGGGDQGTPRSFLGKGVVDLSDNSDVEVRPSGGSFWEGQRRDLGKPNKGHERFFYTLQMTTKYSALFMIK